MIKKLTFMATPSAFISLGLFFMMQTTIKLPHHTETEDFFSENTLMGSSYLVTYKNEVNNKPPDYIFDPNIAVIQYYKKAICYLQPPSEQTIYTNPNKKLTLSRSEIFL